MVQENKANTFLKAAATCSFLGAITTAVLIFVPSPEAPDFESQSLLFRDKLYLSKLWILFIHPQVNLITSLGIGYLLFKRYPLQTVFGTLFLSVWAYTEMSQQALLIDALNQFWRPGYLEADNESSRNMYETLITAASGISDSHYFLVTYGFGLGSLFFGAGLVWERGLGKFLGVSLLFIGLLSLASFARYYLGISSLSPAVNWCYAWVYPYLQPLVRIGLGIWILKELGTKFHNSTLTTQQQGNF